MNASEALGFCKAWLTAWTGNQPDTLISFYEEDAYYQDPAKPMGLRGKNAILPYFVKLLSLNPNWTWRALEVFPTKQGFTLKWEANIPIRDTMVAEKGLDIVEVKNGKITRNEVYFDRTEILKAMTGRNL